MLLCSVLIGSTSTYYDGLGLYFSLPFNDSGQQCNKVVGEMKCRFELQFCQQPHFSFLFLITQHWMQAMKNWLSQTTTQKKNLDWQWKSLIWPFYNLLLSMRLKSEN